MKKLSHLLGVAMLTGIATVTFAEDAPVYDVDNYPPQMESRTDPGVTVTAQPNDEASTPLNLEQRLSRAEQQISNMQNKDSSSKMVALQNEVQTLRGKVEELNHQLEQMQNQQRTQFSDLDKRINETKTKKVAETTSDSNDSETVTPPPVSEETTPKTIEKPQKLPGKVKKLAIAKPVEKTKAKPEAEQPNVAEEQQIYQTAYDLIKHKKYNAAIQALQKMLQKYPTGQFAANAHYWLGELFGLLGKNDQSADEFSSVIQDFPDSPKVSDAQLKLGLINLAQFKWIEAKAAFKKVINRYPGTASARLASEQLKQIKAAGH